MSRALSHVCSSFVPKSSFLKAARYAITVCLVVSFVSTVWGIAPTRFNGVTTVLPIGGVTISLPSDIAVDAAGNVYIADTGNSQIVKINPQGSASVLAISGLSTALSFPKGITVDGSGTLYIADSGNNRVVTVTSAGIGTVVSTPSVTLSSPQGVALDQSGNLFIADTNNNCIVEVTAAGTASMVSITGLGTALNTPTGLAIDPTGNLYIADSLNSRIVKVAAGGSAGSLLAISGLGTALDTPRGVAVDGLGNVYIADTNNNRIVTVTSGGVGSPLSTGAVSLSLPQGVAVSTFGTVYIADTSNNRAVSKASNAVGFGHLQLGTSTGVTQTLPFTVNVATTLGAVKAFTSGTENLDFTVGGGTTCTAGATNTTCTVDIQYLSGAPGLRTGAVVLYDNGTPQAPVVTVPLYGFSDAPVAALSPNPATLISTGGVITQYPFQLALDGAGNMYVGNYVLSGTNPKLVKVPAGGGSASVISTPGFTLSAICGIALDGAGNLFIGDHANNRVIVLTPGGVASELAISGLSPALGEPTEMAFDAAGNLYIADYSPNARIVKVSSLVVAGSTSSGVGTTLATGSYSFTAGKLSGVAVSPDGTVYIASGTDNTSHVVQVTAAGVASLVNSSSLSFLNPQGLTVDGMRNLYVADSNHNRIVEITTAGVASVVSVPGLTTPSTLSAIYGITADASGNVYIPDWTNNRLIYLSVAGSSLTFASTKQGFTSTDSPKTATLTNLGNQDLVLAADPTYTADFSQPTGSVNQCLSATSLTPGTTCNVSVQFTPQSVGSLSAAITLTDNAQNFAGSTQQVSVSGTGITPGDTTAMAVGMSASPVDIAESFTITATVADTTTGHTSTIPTGGVTFSDTVGSSSVSLNGGSAVNLVNGVATLTGVTLSVSGSHTITANYQGVSGSFLASTNTGAVYVRATSTVSLASSANPALLTDSVTFTATVSSVSGSPSGSVNFYDGATLLGSGTIASGTATYATSTLAVGSHSITAAYSGDTQFSISNSSAVSQIISDFTVAIASGGSSSATVTAGGTATYALTISPSAGTTFPAAATLTTAGAPTGSVVTITPSTLAAGASATNVSVTIKVPASAAAIHRSGKMGAAFASIMVGMFLLPWGGRLRRRLGSRGLAMCCMLVALVAAGTLAGCGSDTPATPPPAQPRNYTITLTATSGTVTNSTTLHMTVQ
ncbi:MAG: Ig-like domain repeat protein [Acidobacteriia bacterium]|nr:Ig-like domain repeat protein [Terriglobia bacterium]